MEVRWAEGRWDNEGSRRRMETSVLTLGSPRTPTYINIANISPLQFRLTPTLYPESR